MPGAGKSTIGRLLAKKSGKQFIDSDELIEKKTGEPLQITVDRLGYQALRAIETEILSGLSLEDCVLSTGGSAVYGEAAMQNLKSQAQIIYLQCSPATLKDRVKDFGSRGLAKPATQTLAELYAEREPLYRKFACETICCDKKSEQELVAVVEDYLTL